MGRRNKVVAPNALILVESCIVVLSEAKNLRAIPG